MVITISIIPRRVGYSDQPRAPGRGGGGGGKEGGGRRGGGEETRREREEEEEEEEEEERERDKKRTGNSNSLKVKTYSKTPLSSLQQKAYQLSLG